MNNPTAIILAEQQLESELSSIFGSREMASLIIAGTTLIEHVLSELRDLKFSQCIVLASKNAYEIYEIVNRSKHWGMKVEVMNYSLSKEEVLREFKSLSAPNGLLVIEADRLRSHCVTQFLDKCNQSDYLLYEAMSSSESLGLTYLKPSNADFIINAKGIEMPGVMMNFLKSSRAFHRANMSVMKREFTGLESSVLSHRVGAQLRHWSSEVDNRCNIDELDVMIDQKCRIERNVLMKAVVLNRNVYVERNASLKNTIVMPDAVVPANQIIRNAIVQDETVYQVFE